MSATPYVNPRYCFVDVSALTVTFRGGPEILCSRAVPMPGVGLLGIPLITRELPYRQTCVILQRWAVRW